MRRPLTLLCAVSLCLLWLLPPTQREEPVVLRSGSLPRPVLQSRDQEAAVARWLAVLPPPSMPVEEPAPVVEGNRGAQKQQAARQRVPEQLDGDRFDRLAMCESTMRQDAVGGGGRYLSYFQWSLSTWHAAGGEGDPRNVDYETQKATAMYWASITNPATQWPVCWPRSA